jgi:uncharacterized protein (DUF2147 family)
VGNPHEARRGRDHPLWAVHLRQAGGSDGLRADPQLRDVHNKDAGQNGRPLKGLLMLQGFHAGTNGWEGGTVYNADDGGTYKATITMVDADTLKLRGCIVWPLCKTQTWKRIK